MRVSAPGSGSRGLGSTPDRVIGLCSLTTHFTLPVSLYPGVEMGTGEEEGRPDEMLEGDLAID